MEALDTNILVRLASMENLDAAIFQFEDLKVIKSRSEFQVDVCFRSCGVLFLLVEIFKIQGDGSP